LTWTSIFAETCLEGRKPAAYRALKRLLGETEAAGHAAGARAAEASALRELARGQVRLSHAASAGLCRMTPACLRVNPVLAALGFRT